MDTKINQVYQDWKSALFSTDIPVLERLYTDDFFWINSAGIKSDKTESLIKLKMGTMKYLSWHDEDFNIQVANDQAKITAKQSLSVALCDQK